METFAATVVAVLKKECSHSDQVSTFMGQPVITLASNAITEITELQIEISELIDRYFPDRKEDIMITIRRPGLEDTGFKVWKSK